MADDRTKISQLPLSENLDNDDLMYVVEDDVSKKAEIGYLKTKFTEDIDVPTALADLSDDSTHRVVTDTEKSTWSGKQDALTFDDAPTSGSNNPVKSSGVYDALATKANSADLATVATTGDYDDLTDKPTIPVIEANPSGEATAEMQKLQIDSTIYKFASQKAYGEITDVDIASFSDGADDEPLAKLEVGIEAVQEGSGDPSPSNVRPIIGRSAVNVLNLDLPNGSYTASNRQISFAWKDGDTEYDMPFNVMANETVKDSSDNDVDVLTLESEYVIPFDVVYDAPEAIIALDSGQTLSAGDYYFKIVNDSWGGNNNKYVSFTLDSELSGTKQIRKMSGAYNAAIENCTLGIYTSGKDAVGTALAFTVGTEEPSSGTSLGRTDGSGDLNHWHCVVLGYNRWKFSAIRQFLNSDADKNNWWVQQHKWDVMPSYATTADGFLKGMDPAVLAHIKTTEVKTVRNTVFNSGDTPLGGFDTTFDKIFLVALEQTYIQPQESGEGTYWPYYKELLNVNSPVARGATYPELKKYDLAAKTTSRTRWLRSCNRGSAGTAWCVGSSGSVNSSGAESAGRCAPCLRIGINDKKSITWSEAGTVYGGVLDVTSGVLTVTHANIASYNGEIINEPWISSEDAYSEGATPTTGAQVVYPLTTPITVQLTPTQVKSLLGNNNIWADNGQIKDVIYVRDLNTYLKSLDDRITALENA